MLSIADASICQVITKAKLLVMVTQEITSNGLVLDIIFRQPNFSWIDSEHVFIINLFIL